jgi:hypothetical protein
MKIDSHPRTSKRGQAQNTRLKVAIANSSARFQGVFDRKPPRREFDAGAIHDPFVTSQN